MNALIYWYDIINAFGKHFSSLYENHYELNTNYKQFNPPKLLQENLPLN